MSRTEHARSALHIRARRGTVFLGVAALASIGLVGAGVQPAFAVHEKQMQLDGNTADDSSATPAYDWESFFQAGADGTGGDITDRAAMPSTDFVARGHIADYALPDASTFATGSKDTLNIGAIAATPGHKATAAGWQCGSSNNVSSKDDLVNVYTAAYRDPNTDHLLLYFGAEKSSNLGDNNIGIWFLQDSIACTSGNGNTSFTGHHKPGDVLLTASFSNGGTVATVESHVWESGTENGGEGHLGSDDAGAFLCGDTNHTETSASAHACAITNTVGINPPWNHPVKTPAAGTTSWLAPQEFYEGGIDVTEAADNADVNEPCITNFLADTRSSTSPTATLFDYGAGSFPVCTPTTTMLNTAAYASATSVHAGESVTFTFYEKNDGNVALTSPHLTSSNSGCNATLASTKNATDDSGTATIDETQFNVGDADFDGVLDPGEEWTFTCSTSFVAGTTNPHVTVFGHGTDSFTGNDVTYYTTGTTTPVPCVAGTVDTNGRFCDLQETTSVPVTLVNPGTTLRESVSALVTFSYFEKNTGDVRINGVSVTSTCAGDSPATATPTYKNQADDPATLLIDESKINVGDTNGDTWLDPGETWTFTCQKTVSASSTTASATFSDSGTGHGTDGLGTTVPTTNETDSSSVTVTNDSPNTAP